MVNTLLKRLFEAHAKGKVVALLKAAKKKHNADRDAYKTSGSDDEVIAAVRAAIIEEHISERQIASLVDSVEENGGQHVFLFNLSEEGKKALTPAAFAKNFTAVPAKPSEAFYAQYPAQTRTHYEQRGKDIVVKQVYTTEFWKRNEDESKESANRRTVVYDRVRRRSINLLKITGNPGEVEVRIDRVHGQDDKLAQQLLDDFKTSLSKLVDFDEHFVPVPVVNAFDGILAARDETFMTIDEAFDPSTSMRFANRREDARGKDIREHEGYTAAIAEKALSRESLRVYWLYNDKKVHSIISALEVTNATTNEVIDYGKVFINAKLDPDELDHVIARIRHFAR